jgi:hypothetical protein
MTTIDPVNSSTSNNLKNQSIDAEIQQDLINLAKDPQNPQLIRKLLSDVHSAGYTLETFKFAGGVSLISQIEAFANHNVISRGEATQLILELRQLMYQGE